MAAQTFSESGCAISGPALETHQPGLAREPPKAAPAIPKAKGAKRCGPPDESDQATKGLLHLKGLLGMDAAQVEGLGSPRRKQHKTCRKLEVQHSIGIEEASTMVSKLGQTVLPASQLRSISGLTELAQ